MAPHGNYRCRGDDSWIAVRSDAEWARLCSVMGSQELAYDDRFVNFPSRQLYADELDRIVDTNYDPHVTAGVRLVSVIQDNLQHAGQARYLRGMIGRLGI